MDVVYPLKATGEPYYELRYSLRSLRNLDHDRVFIVGGCPRWATNVVHLPTTQNRGKYDNLCHNIEVACKSDFISDPFIIFNDDFIVMQPVKEVTFHWRETVDEGIERYKKHGRMNDWIQPMKDVKLACEILGIENPVSYELHIPMVVHKEPMLQALQMIPHGPVWRTMYGNLARVGGTKIPDVKIYSRRSSVPPGPYVSTNDDVFPFGAAAKQIRKTFSKQSRYES